MATAAIYFEIDGYDTSGEKLMGRQAAGAGFLRAAALHAGSDRLYCYARREELAREFATRINDARPGAVVSWVPFDEPAGLQVPGCLYVPGPGLSGFASQRLRIGDRRYSLCGVTHTTASHSAMEELTGLLVAPLRSWDAVVCTSRAVRDTTRTLIEAQADYLRWRLGATRFELPQLPLIPLGVHTDDFAAAAGVRNVARTDLGIGSDDVAFLFVGRLSFHAKAHPLPMYLALEQAARGRTVHLLLCGWFANSAIEQAFRDGAARLAPSVRLVVLDGRDAAVRRRAWAAADVFTSLSDNVQETFGLTPIEAMAAGLPVVVTDWDGYRDTVRDGIDGFRIPTLMPPAPLGADLATRYDVGRDSYDMHCGLVSQMVAVDVEACTQAYARLIDDGALRKRMGDAAREHARSHFDWRIVFSHYRDLWADLSERRRADADLGGTAPTEPAARPDPFLAFASYPTARLGDAHRVQRTPGTSMTVLAERRNLAMVSFAHDVFPLEDDCALLLKHLADRESCRVDELLQLVPPSRSASFARGLVWLAKMGILRITSP
jgi:starch synthase